jgi:hypothetical protein
MDTRQIIDRARQWADYHTHVQARRTVVRIDAERALERLQAALVTVPLDGDVIWRVLPLGPADAPALRDVSRAVTLAPVSPEDDEAIRQLADAVPEALAEVDAVSGPRRLLATSAARAAAADAVEFLTEYVEWGAESGLTAALRRLEPEPDPTDLTVADALSPQVGLAAIWRKLGTAELVDAGTARPTGGAPTSSATEGPDLTALRTALASGAATHLAVLSTPPHTAAELVAALRG